MVVLIQGINDKEDERNCSFKIQKERENSQRRGIPYDGGGVENRPGVFFLCLLEFFSLLVVQIVYVPSLRDCTEVTLFLALCQ